MSRRTLIQAISAGLLAVAIVLIATAAWIPAKAWLAQRLLEHSWSQTLADGQRHKPWPWADHWPIARLRFIGHQRSYVVLQGDSGAVLAFAPGHNPKSGLGDDPRSIIISGHRDTSFEVLQTLQPGDIIELTTATGRRHFKVDQTRVINENSDALWITHDARLYLVTCWPFDAIIPGGPLRYVVEARPVPEPCKPQRRTAPATHSHVATPTGCNHGSAARTQGVLAHNGPRPSPG